MQNAKQYYDSASGNRKQCRSCRAYTLIAGKFYDTDNSKYNLSVFFYLAMQRYNYSLHFSSFYGVNNIIYYNNCK
jgi:hypothetical protein